MSHTQIQFGYRWPFPDEFILSAWDQVFRIPLLGSALKFLGAFPVKIDRFDRDALHDARTVLESGKVLMIFPEGARTLSGFLQPFKPGVSRMALAIGTTIVPVTINGGYAAWPPHHLFPRPKKVTVTYHAPITVENLGHNAPPHEIRQAARELSQSLRAQVASVLESQYLPADVEALSTES